MRIPKEIYNFLAYELSHYYQYKTLLAKEDICLIASSDPTRRDGIPNELLTAKMMITCRQHIEAIEQAGRNLKHRLPDFPAFFKVYFVDGEKNIDRVCRLVHISRETFYRYKRAIIAELGAELGLLKR